MDTNLLTGSITLGVMIWTYKIAVLTGAICFIIKLYHPCKGDK